MKKVKVLADPMLTVMASILIIAFTGGFILFLRLFVFQVLPNPEDRVLGITVCVGLMLCCVILQLLLIRAGYVCYVFSTDGVIIRIPFKKSVLKPYSEYPYIRLGAYFHSTSGGSLGRWRAFIVFSNRRLKDDELYGINNVACSENLIKVRYSEKTYQKLYAILPLKLRSAFEREMNVRPPTPSLNRTSKKKKRKKKKKR